MKLKNSLTQRIALCLALITLPAGFHSTAVSESSNAPEPVSTPETEITDAGPVRIKKTNDPFANTVAMIRKVSENNPLSNTISAITGSMNLRLRGAVIDKEGNSFALLEVDKGAVHVVQVGDSLSLKTHGHNSSVKIMAIHRQSVEVEFGEHESYIIVR